jgi:hypothetical protein
LAHFRSCIIKLCNRFHCAPDACACCSSSVLAVVDPLLLLPPLGVASSPLLELAN